MSMKVIQLGIGFLLLFLVLIGGFNFLYLFFKESNPKFETMSVFFSVEGETVEEELSISIWQIIFLSIMGVLALVSIVIIFSAIKEMVFS